MYKGLQQIDLSKLSLTFFYSEKSTFTGKKTILTGIDRGEDAMEYW